MTFPTEEALNLSSKSEVFDRRVLQPGWLALFGIALAVGFVTPGMQISLLDSGVISAVVVSVFFLIAGTVAFNFEPPSSRILVLLLWVLFGVATVAGGQTEQLVVWLILGVATLVGAELLSRACSKLRAAAATDPLTGLNNRAGLLEEFSRAVAVCRRTDQPLCMVHIDLDDFKGINDREGHARGDHILQACADSWSGVIRESDILARIGGDEFLLVLPGSNSNDARRLMGVLKEVSPTEWSYGVAELAPGEELQACVDRADAELYAQKVERQAYQR